MRKYTLLSKYQSRNFLHLSYLSKNNYISVMSRQQEINKLILTMGVKKSFLAQKLGVSRQVLGYQLNIATDLDYEYYVKILDILHTIRKETKSVERTVINTEAKQESYTESNPATLKNFYRYRIEATVPAGDGEMVLYDDWFESDVLDYNPNDHVFIRVDEEFGHSMMPLVSPGDLVLISFSAKPKNGDLVAARWDETKGALKIYQELPHDPSTIILLSYNQATPVIPIQKRSSRIYKVVLLKKQR